MYFVVLVCLYFAHFWLILFFRFLLSIYSNKWIDVILFSLSWNKIFCAKLLNAAVVQQPKKWNKHFTHLPSSVTFLSVEFYVKLVCPSFQFTLHFVKNPEIFVFLLYWMRHFQCTFRLFFVCVKLSIAVHFKWSSIAVRFTSKTRLSSFLPRVFSRHAKHNDSNNLINTFIITNGRFVCQRISIHLIKCNKNKFAFQPIIFHLIPTEFRFVSFFLLNIFILFNCELVNSIDSLGNRVTACARPLRSLNYQI